MKPVLHSLVRIILISHVSIISCKEKLETLPPPNNEPPIARAGADQNIQLSSCSSPGTAELDGTASTDPENNIARYIWEQLSGTTSVYLSNSNSAKASVSGIVTGTYTFQLSVVDAAGSISRDEVLIIAKGPIEEYDLDISFSGLYSFTDNLEDCYYTPCSYYDYTLIQGFTNFPPIGDFNLYINEWSDTATSSPLHNTYFVLSTTNVNGISVSGPLNVNFKNMIQNGGGPINGKLDIENGSAQACNSEIFENLAPLNVTGTLDTVAKSVTLRITGKVYF